MAGFLAFLLSADVRGGILNIKPYHFWNLVVRGCPRPPWSPTSYGKAVVRGLYGFFVGFGLFLVCHSNVICAISPLPFCSCSAFFRLLPRRSNPAMADSKLVCLHCALEFSAADGRQHGRHFRCKNCESALRQIRRNWDSSGEFHTGGAAWLLPQACGGKAWQWPRAMVHSPGILAHGHDQQDHEWLPQWRPRKETSFGGLGEQRLERRNNSTHAIRVQWRIRLRRLPSESPARDLVWSEWEDAGKGLCNRSSMQASKKKGSKADNDLDLPAAAAADSKKSENKEAKTQAAALKKLQAENLRMSTRAAKAVGLLQSNCTALHRLCTRAEKCPDHVPAPVLQTAQTVLTKLDSWAKDARACMNKDESQKSLPEGSELQALSLAFSPEDLKTSVRGSFQVGPQSLASEGREGQSRPEAAGGGPGAGSQAPASHRKERWVNVRLHVTHAISCLSRRWDEIHCRSHSRRWRFCAWEFN